MTSGIQGTGPYSKLKSLRSEASDLKYEIEMKDPGPRTLKKLRMQLIENARQIKELLEIIKSEKLPTQSEIDAGPHAGIGLVPEDYSTLK